MYSVVYPTPIKVWDICSIINEKNKMFLYSTLSGASTLVNKLGVHEIILFKVVLVISFGTESDKFVSILVVFENYTVNHRYACFAVYRLIFVIVVVIFITFKLLDGCPFFTFLLCYISRDTPNPVCTHFYYD